MTALPLRIEGARRATVLRYGGSLWVTGYWPDTTLSIELRPVRRDRSRVLLLGPPVAGARSLAIDLGPAVAVEALATALAEWIETPALSVRRVEQTWRTVARGLAARLTGGTLEGIPA
ncbi:MAG: hypothetical protein O3A10_10095 [Chloroflexi bacterium]|nr:hypothetical protein [Chloroflexota bacterium]MDA1146520.1 hypothetical protein [Chloroflexota bacterium]